MDDRVDDADQHDQYIAQLKEVFNSCDQTGTGSLGKEELFVLCHKLQLEDQAEYLVNGLLKDEDSEVDFDVFKESFVNILCQTVNEDCISEEENEDEEEEEDDEEETEEDDDQEVEELEEAEPVETEGLKQDPTVVNDDDAEVSPKYVKGDKKYGRKSAPFTSDDFERMADDEEDEEGVTSLKNSLANQGILNSDQDGSDTSKRRQLDSESGSDEDDEKEMFEAEGQMNLMMADMEMLTEEEEYLRGIWESLGVGHHGYITLEELAAVCKHIGMDEMNSQELQELFDKLDADGDGRVSFHEFQDELFQHNTPAPTPQLPSTPRSIQGTPTTRAVSAQKKLKMTGASMGEDRTTPSIVQGSGVSGLFSTLDPDRTGFAKPESITDLWEKYNVTNGIDVLMGLGFDVNAKVNLLELSAALEQELVSADEQNVIFLAAVASYQQEIRNTKSELEQLGLAKQKLTVHLADSNARNTLLAKEIDERHAVMEKSAENKLLAIEKKYQDQVKGLQAELDRERETYSSQAARHKQTLDSEMDELKQEEAKLRDQLFQTQKEMEKVSHDLDETAKQLQESERQNQRLQRELEAVDDLHRKLSDFESKGLLSPDEQKFTREKLLRLEQENKDLKDQNDELTAELENSKQSTSAPRKTAEQGSVDKSTPSRIPVREGSVLSDYIKPTILKRASISSTDSYDDDRIPSRRLPGTPALDDDNISIGSGTQDQIELLKQENEQLQRNFSIERKEIEQAYKLEITAVEEKHDAEKAELLQKLQKDKVKLSDEFGHQQEEALAELGRELQTKFVHEKQDLIEKYETKFNLREQQFLKEKEKLTQKLKEELAENLKAQLDDLRAQFDQEKFQLEETLSEVEPEMKRLERKNTDLQKKLKKQREELETSFQQEKKEMEELFSRHMKTLGDMEEQKNDLESQYQQQIAEMDTLLKQEQQAMQSQVDRHQQEVKDLQKQRTELELRMKQQREELELAYRQEKQEMEELYQTRLREMTTAQQENISLLEGGVAGLKGKTKEDFFHLLDELKDKLVEKERTSLGEDFEKKTVELQQQFDTQKSELLHLLDKEKEELEEKYTAQIEALRNQLSELQNKLEEEREALIKQFEGEREDIENQMAEEIREELEEEVFQQMEDIKEAFEAEKNEFEAQTKLLKQEVEELQLALEAEDKTRKRLEELNKANNKLQQEKRQAERGQHEMREALESTKKALEARIDELMAEKDGAISAVKAEFVESSKQIGKDKAVYDAVVLEKEALESQLARMNQTIVDLQILADKSTELQHLVDTLKEEKEELLKNVSSLKEQSSNLTQTLAELTKEKCELEEKVKELQQKTAETDDIHQKYSHLQECVLDTEERLVDTQATLDQAEKELQDALAFKSKYKHVQKKYEDVCSERDRALNLVSSLREQLNQASSESKENNEDKGRLAKVLEEKKDLEVQLQKVSDKLLEATTNFAVCQSQHIRELQQWKDQSHNMVDLNRYTRLQIELVDHQRSLRDLQESIKTKEENSAKTFTETLQKHAEEVKTLENVKENLSEKLRSLQKILDGQVDKFKEQFEASEKRNTLVVDLYKENSELMEALYHMEEQKKDAVSRCYKLEDQCRNLRTMLKRVAHVALT